MKTINKSSENMGGILRIWALPPADISISGKVVSILSDANMVAIYLQQDSSGFDEQLSDAFAGSCYLTEISAIVPCDNPETLVLIAAMERQGRYLVIFIDGNGNYKLAGTIQTPLRFSAKATTGTTAASLNHYAISFTGQQRERAVFIGNPFP